jgi:hypothetical protein
MKSMGLAGCEEFTEHAKVSAVLDVWRVLKWAEQLNISVLSSGWKKINFCLVVRRFARD